MGYYIEIDTDGLLYQSRYETYRERPDNPILFITKQMRQAHDKASADRQRVCQIMQTSNIPVDRYGKPLTKGSMVIYGRPTNQPSQIEKTEKSIWTNKMKSAYIYLKNESKPRLWQPESAFKWVKQ